MMTQTIIKEKPTIKLRHELKHTINSTDSLILSSRLSKLFKYDSNANSQGQYIVSSLYFDTPSDSALRQKNDGLNYREKFRLRYYNNDTSFIRLEKKFKKNGLCGKYSASITKAEVALLLDNNIDFLFHSENPLMIELYSKMRGQLLSPKTIVTYTREAYLFEPGNVRITIDSNLLTGLNNINFLETETLHANISNSLSILEIKYDEFLPDIVKLAVQTPNRTASSNSKYALCRKHG